MSDHDVVLYGNDSDALTYCVVPFIASAVQDRGAAIVIASTEHERAFRSALADLGIDSQSGELTDRLIFLNATETIRGLLIDGVIDHERFARLVGDVVRKLSERYTVHAYGEMAGILRGMGRSDDAARLEYFAAQLLSEVPFRQLSGYPIDIVGGDFQPNAMSIVQTTRAQLMAALLGTVLPVNPATT